MGYQTDFVGYLQIDPPLGPRERSAINRIAGSPYLREPGAPLRVADEDDELLRGLLRDAPRGWSNWGVCDEGCCLSYNGGDKANHMVPWLRFLMATFLVPGAPVEGIPGMTCDHLLTGMVVGSRRDTRELFSITARGGDIEVELLWPGNPQWSDYPRLGYQIEIDRVRAWVTDQRSRGWPALKS
ncbi:hypothetical protein [Nocardioides sp. YIM 152588]|uniref:hypothetical protein n=1 Tax=Nocardioides sp. YIM 152588 TaxID=3158259 RepID=UPI0032E3D286